jgi:hypothetical protein
VHRYDLERNAMIAKLDAKEKALRDKERALAVRKVGGCTTWIPCMGKQSSKVGRYIPKWVYSVYYHRLKAPGFNP